jgi:Putative prokaryotic signal transducing protein
MAQDPEPDEPTESTEQIDRSHDLDMVALYESMTIEAEVEATVLKSLLEANGIPAVVVTSPIPSVGFQVQVQRARLAEARRLVEEAELAGPQAAAEAEQATEGQ